MAQLCCKLRASFLLYIAMILLSFLIKKFEYIRPLLYDLRILLHYTNELATDQGKTESPTKKKTDKRQSLANIQIYLKNLKEIANTLLSKAEGRQKSKDPMADSEDSDDADDPFLRNFKMQQNNEDEETRERKKREEENKQQSEMLRKKMDEFLVLWLRQIVIFNTHYVLHLALTNSNMASILDVRPSIVKATSIKYALVSLMNPRLQSIQQVNNFKSMKRILDNIVSYFFQNFLSTKDRAMIVEDLQKVRNNLIRIDACKYLKFSHFFESNEEFQKFYSFMDLNYYISNVNELELSLVKHTNKDYSQSTLQRVHDVYKNGIEIFKQQTEHIKQFCFDYCENDICAFVMKEEGIREIKLLQSLTLRNRTDCGLAVFDEELDNWSECLHRYDNYPKDDVHRSQHDVITGAVTSLYKEKTINYTKLKKMGGRSSVHQSIGNTSKLMISDIEPRPPQIWSGKDSSEFIKMGSMKMSSSHFDYSTCIAAHPKLPLYVTGNNKGKL